MIMLRTKIPRALNATLNKLNMFCSSSPRQKRVKFITSLLNFPADFKLTVQKRSCFLFFHFVLMWGGWFDNNTFSLYLVHVAFWVGFERMSFRADSFNQSDKQFVQQKIFHDFETFHLPQWKENVQNTLSLSLAFSGHSHQTAVISCWFNSEGSVGVRSRWLRWLGPAKPHSTLSTQL